MPRKRWLRYKGTLVDFPGEPKLKGYVKTRESVPEFISRLAREHTNLVIESVDEDSPYDYCGM